jgi:hypothetical protein
LKFIYVFCVLLNTNHCLLTSARITRFIATFAASSPFDNSGSSSFDDTAAAITVANVVVGFLSLCARRFVVGLSPLGIAIEPPDIFGNGLFTDGIAVVASPDGRTGATALTFEAIHAK